MKKFLFVLLVTGLVFSAGPVWAKDGLYLGMDLGVAVAPDMDIKTGGLDDWPDTRCDATINPDRLQAGHCGMILLSGARRSRLMAARGFWRDWPWGIAWAASGSRVNISIAAPGMAARLNLAFPTPRSLMACGTPVNRRNTEATVRGNTEAVSRMPSIT